MSRLRISLAAGVLALLSTPVTAELCAIDAVPAATILVPYFEVDLDRFGTSKFEHTTVTLINTQPAPAVAHVILWTDLSVPVLNFDVLLTGFDEHEMDIDAIFTRGALPIPAGQSTTGGCTGVGPDGSVINFSPDDTFTRADLINAHTGQPVDFYGGQCMGRRLGGRRIARGYITIDNVNQCSRLFPGDGGYFVNGGDGIANNLNAFKASITRFSKKFLTEVPAISIEAGTESGLSTPGNYTFYGRFNNFDASDNRECGGIGWGVPWERRNGFKTEITVWRDSGFEQGPFDCSQGPDWLPLSQELIRVFNAEEQAQELAGNPFPAETQKVEIGKGPLNTRPFDSGWLYLLLAPHERAETPGYVTYTQRFRQREGEALGHVIRPDNDEVPLTYYDTICGQPVPNGLRARPTDR